MRLDENGMIWIGYHEKALAMTFSACANARAQPETAAINVPPEIRQDMNPQCNKISQNLST